MILMTMISSNEDKRTRNRTRTRARARARRNSSSPVDQKSMTTAMPLVVISMLLVVVLLLSTGTVIPAAATANTNTNDDDKSDIMSIQHNFDHVATTRSERFPSIEQRVKLYMSNWYTPPCTHYKDGHILYKTIVDDNDDEEQQGVENDQKKEKKADARDNNNNILWPSVRIEGYRDHPLVNQSERVIQVESIVEPDTMFFLEQSVIMNCANETHYELYGDEAPSKAGYDDPTGVSLRTKFRINMKMYCADVKLLVLPALAHVELEKKHRRRQQQQQQQQDQNDQNDVLQSLSQSPLPPPTLLQFGDNKQSHIYGDVMVPHIKKFRSSASTLQDLADVTTTTTTTSSSAKDDEGDYDSDVQCYSTPRPVLKSKHGDDRFQPIVWKLATDRHYKKLYQIYREDTPWYKKKDMAVFRGQLTGSRDGYDKNLSDEQNCHNLKRCRLVYNHANSTLIDARLTSTRGRLPSVLNGVPLEGEKVRVYTLLEYKGIIMIEGNDVASGLKWALLSQSVVLMPPPKHTSWAMEELLQPWVHYIPLNDFATDVEEKMQWIVDNDEEAQRISERATLWMEDLVFHPDAAEDDRLIQEEIIRRYQRHFIRDEDDE